MWGHRHSTVLTTRLFPFSTWDWDDFATSFPALRCGHQEKAPHSPALTKLGFTLWDLPGSHAPIAAPSQWLRAPGTAAQKKEQASPETDCLWLDYFRKPLQNFLATLGYLLTPTFSSFSFFHLGSDHYHPSDNSPNLSVSFYPSPQELPLIKSMHV